MRITEKFRYFKGKSCLRVFTYKLINRLMILLLIICCNMKFSYNVDKCVIISFKKKTVEGNVMLIR